MSEYLYTEEEIQQMSPEEKRKAFREELAAMSREKTRTTSDLITIVDTDTNEEKIYAGGKVKRIIKK